MIFRFLLFGLVFYYLFKFLARIFGVFIINKAQKQYSNQSNPFNQQKKKEGEINITDIPKDNKKHVQGGDYVDFEEIE